jgi:hypothetical protein
MTNGETNECYIVDEDGKNYVVRKDIDRLEEYTIPRTKVMFVARSNPTDLVGKAGKTGIDLTWNPPFVPGEKYRIYLRADSETTFLKIAETQKPRYAIKDLKNNTKYIVYVTSIDPKGTESLPSEHISVSTSDILSQDSKEISDIPANVPEGFSVYYSYFIPLKKPFRKYYDSLDGAGFDYYMRVGSFFSAGAGISLLSGNDNNWENTNVSLNSFSLSGRIGYPFFGLVYPYMGVSGRITWFSENSAYKSAEYTGYGGDAFAGCALILSQQASIWADYSISFVWLNDKGRTDIRGSVIRGGVMYAF